MIAGTYTPFALVTLRGAWGWSLFGVAWGLAAVGVGLKFWFTGRFQVASTVIYVLMGWMVLIAIKPLLAAMDGVSFGLLVGGGVSYTGGAAFYLSKRQPYHHAVWHVFVLGGSACHYFAVWHTLAATWA
nr:hemolysin III family protein [Horticoccus luteus]